MNEKKKHLTHLYNCIHSFVCNRAVSCRSVRTSVRMLQEGQAQSVLILPLIRIESTLIVYLAFRPPPLVHFKKTTGTSQRLKINVQFDNPSYTWKGDFSRNYCQNRRIHQSGVHLEVAFN